MGRMDSSQKYEWKIWGMVASVNGKAKVFTKTDVKKHQGRLYSRLLQRRRKTDSALSVAGGIPAKGRPRT